jgi:hypothetical protein
MHPPRVNRIAAGYGFLRRWTPASGSWRPPRRRDQCAARSNPPATTDCTVLMPPPDSAVRPALAPADFTGKTSAMARASLKSTPRTARRLQLAEHLAGGLFRPIVRQVLKAQRQGRCPPRHSRQLAAIFGWTAEILQRFSEVLVAASWIRSRGARDAARRRRAPHAISRARGEHGRRVSPTFRRLFQGLPGSANPPPRAGKYAPPARHRAKHVRIARTQQRSLHPATSYGRACDRAPILPSEPANSRTMFGRCITHSSAASAANSHALRGSPNDHSIKGVAALAIRAESEE